MLRKLILYLCFVAVFGDENAEAKKEPPKDEKGGYKKAPANDPRAPKQASAPKPTPKPSKKEKALIILDSGKVLDCSEEFFYKKYIPGESL